MAKKITALNETTTINDENLIPLIQGNETKAITKENFQIGLKPVVLYDNSTGSNGTITLNDSVTNYSYIEIYYRSNDGYLSSKKVIAGNNYVDLVAFQPLKTANVVTYAKLRVVSINNNTISTRQEDGDFFAKEILVSDTGYQQTATNNIFITRVLGYK